MVLLPWLYALFGVVIGSFLNVCIYRIPRDESIVFPSSHCPQCGARIRPYDNVPVLSYLWLAGRCRSCKALISPQYPAVELLNGAAFYFCAVEWDVSPTTLLNSLFLSALIILVFIDYQHQILPNAITIPGAVAGILLSPFQSQGLYLDTIAFAIASKVGPDAPLSFLNWTGAALGALTGGGVLYLVARIHKVVHNLVARIREAVPKLQGLGMGMGDIKMMAMVGAFLGWRLALLTIFAGSFIGSIAGVFLILFHGRNLQSKLAFGTFLGIGAALALFFGPSFLRWYSSYLPIPIR